MSDQTIICRRCGTTFSFSEGEQEFYNSKNLSAPQRCKDCRNDLKNERGTREMHNVVCTNCGTQCQVPFKPRTVEEGGKPVLFCKACFMAQRPG